MAEWFRHGGARGLALLQGLYFSVTGVWPLVHLDSFLAVTGPKTDLWLVQTVGALLGVVGVVLLLAAFRGDVRLETIVMGVGTAVVLGAADVVFTQRDVIPPVYLGDAAVEATFVGWWAAVAVAARRRA